MFGKQKTEIKGEMRDERMEEMRNVLAQYHLSDANEQTIKELQNYLNEDFVRFYTTFGMLPEKEKALKVFEIGANPYYLTVLMKLYTKYDITCANCFNDEDLSYFEKKQCMVYTGGVLKYLG